MRAAFYACMCISLLLEKQSANIIFLYFDIFFKIFQTFLWLIFYKADMEYNID